MLPAFASSSVSRPPLRARTVQRSLFIASFIGLLVILLSVVTLSRWRPDFSEVLSKTSSLLHQPQAGIDSSLPTPEPPPPPPPAPSEPPVSPALASSHTLNPELSEVPKDPLSLPGWREETKWVTNDPSAQMHHWMQQLIEGQDGPELDWVRNKTVLLLGDSVLRGWVFHLCGDFFSASRNRLTFSDDEDVDEKNEGWECVIPQTGTRFINGFVYGMTNYSKYPLDSPLISHDWPVGPWGIEDRIPAVVDQYSSFNVDMVVLNSGAWDMKFMYRRDVFEGRKNIDIDHDELVELSERLRECMRMIQAAWPSSKLAFLETQPFDALDTLNRWIWAQNLTQYGGHDWGVNFTLFTTEEQTLPFLMKTLPPMFTRRRVGQLATTYRRIAAEEGWDGLDLWKIAEATEPGEFYPKTDPVHPAVPSIHVILDFVLEKLWRWETFKV